MRTEKNSLDTLDFEEYIDKNFRRRCDNAEHV